MAAGERGDWVRSPHFWSKYTSSTRNACFVDSSAAVSFARTHCVLEGSSTPPRFSSDRRRNRDRRLTSCRLLGGDDCFGRLSGPPGSA